MSAVTLYSTDGCHLCQEAEALLQQLCASYVVVDIIEDASLVEKYGIKIPVVAKSEPNIELDWPFDLAMLKQFLEV